jgi:DNA-binding MarR family transcriptional regulator
MTNSPSVDRPIPSPSKADAVTELVLAVFRVHDALMRRGDEIVAPIGLTSARWQVLGAVALAGEPLTVPAIGKAMGLSRQGVQKQVDLLREERLVALQDNPSHQRSPLVALTRTGRAAYKRAMQAWGVEARVLGRDHSVAELEGARRVVAALVTSLDRARKDGDDGEHNPSHHARPGTLRNRRADRPDVGAKRQERHDARRSY